MALRDRLRRLEKAMWGKLKSFERADGRRYYFDPEEAFKATFMFLADSLRADYKREPRPEPPEILRAVAGAKDRGEALFRVRGDFSHLPLDKEALVERGEFAARSLVAGREYGDDVGVGGRPSAKPEDLPEP